MLRLSEHFEYYCKDHLATFVKVSGWEQYFQKEVEEESIYFANDLSKKCLNIRLSNFLDQRKCMLSSSYYIGLDRLNKLGLNVYVEPKLNNQDLKLDYIKLLIEALSEEENFGHLNGLIDAKFEEEWLEVESKEELLLTPFLVAQFLSAVKYLVRKGLKKSYYNRQENLRNRVKGKILVGDQVKQNILKNRLNHTTCSYQEFGFDTEVNRFLKYVLKKIQGLLSGWSNDLDLTQELQNQLNYCKGGFQQVSDFGYSSFKGYESNPFYKNYNVAIALGNQILKLEDYNISNLKESKPVKHPRFWIDMSKLFELFVFKKLRDLFPLEGEVQYHCKFNHQEPDFILNTKSGIKAIVDAKYKPRYKRGNPSMEDARQLAGYSRLNSIYNELGVKKDIIIPALIVYPSELVILDVEFEQNYDIDNDFEGVEQNTNSLISNLKKLGEVRRSKAYNEFYMSEVHLEYINTNLS